MAADVLSEAGLRLSIFEKRKGPGRKILVAGSSGLNISNNLAPQLFVKQYSGATPQFWETLFQEFSVANWIEFVEKSLGIRTFVGTTGHYFVEGMRASRFLRAWLTRLGKRGVEIYYHQQLSDFEKTGQGVRLKFGDKSFDFTAAVFALGGGSWEEPLPVWPALFESKGIAFEPWRSSNSGFKVAWPKALLEEAEGEPLKNVVMTSPRGKRQGDIVITKYGVEGMPVYHVGQSGRVHLDLQPALTVEKIIEKCEAVKENLASLRRLKKKVALSPAANALLFHLSLPESRKDLPALAALVKKFPLDLLAPQPLPEAISSAGGVKFSELSQTLELTKFPGIYLAGEMLDWDVSTGGFLIQAAVSQGRLAGTALRKRIS